MWDDDAQVREKKSLLANLTTEPDTPTKTPFGTVQVGGLLTPATGTRYGDGGGGGSSTARDWSSARRRLDFSSRNEASPSKIRRSVHPSLGSSDEDETYSWDESLDNEADKLLSRGSGGSTTTVSTFLPKQPVFTPNNRNTSRTATNTTPGKRKFQDPFFDEPEHDKPPPYSESVPSETQSSSATASITFSSVEVSATPTPRRYKDVLSAQQTGESHHIPDLASKVLGVLDRNNVTIPAAAKAEIIALLEQQYLKTQGIIRGRDISRMALKKKDEEIQALKERIEQLETEREMDKIVISCLRDKNSS